ncbi:MAG: 50S ribosomal protein L9 [Patescibacteria group bacterium]
MKVILLKDIPKLGRKYDVKEVSSGHAINFLIPQKLVETATPEAIVRVKEKQAEHLTHLKVQEELLNSNFETLKEKTIIIKGKVNEEGHLYAKIHAKEIMEALKTETRLELPEGSIILDEPIKEIGEYLIKIKINRKEGEFKLTIERE